MKEWQNSQYGSIIERKKLCVSHGGKCVMYRNINNEHVDVQVSSEFQAKHEEANTLIAFHARTLVTETILVRFTDTDVLVILLGLVGCHNGASIIMDYGNGNNRRYINISDIAHCFDTKRAGFTDALIGFCALTGCAFIFSFYRKGKVKPFGLLDCDCLNRHNAAMCSLTSEVDIPAVTPYVCSLYGFDTEDVDYARCLAFMRMVYGTTTKPLSLSKIKRINCTSIPPCSKTLLNHIRRSNYVAKLWKRAEQADPTEVEPAVKYDWTEMENGLEPEWFVGYSLPDSLDYDNECCPNVIAEKDNKVAEEDDEWIEDSGDSDEEKTFT